ncbi:MAG: preprotein translocase subunit SecA, partial [Chloroflexi bacterium]|nr:preprotein translocase subunit SecA [Chloroflexota bacterium]
MLKWLASLTDSNEKEIKRLQPTINQINSLEPDFQKLSDAELRAKTVEFKSRLKDGETLDDLLPEAFAATREAASRTIGQRHYDVQLMGGIVLHQGKIAEMKTGEGKTLVATLPLYLKALTGQGCHLVTVNDYLARRDAYWMGPIYHALGLTVASIYPPQSPTEQLPARLYDPSYTDEKDTRWTHFKPITRQDAYKADITYGTNNEFGFDYLRDNMATDLSQRIQRLLNYAIVDEVDNILIDEARTPLIISASFKNIVDNYYSFAHPSLVDEYIKEWKRRYDPQNYRLIDDMVGKLRRDEDYTIEEKEQQVFLNESGASKIEKMLFQRGLINSPDLSTADTDWHRYIKNALKAHEFFKRDRNYVVKDSQVIIVDEFTGRLMFGRRYSEGLHQAIEAKERVEIIEENLTPATITFQNYFRLYEKLAGMTGTAATEAEEFYKIYKLDVVTIPTHKPMIRTDFPDQIYKDEDAKFKAAAREIEEFHKQGRPVLIGTVSIEVSEQLSELLKRRGITHQVLNAKNHEKEAAIIAQAGRLGAVTVATNMAGRGVDIILGGNPDGRDPQDWQQEHDRVVQLGGLHVIGTERHEARRIDNQLRGRSGRQGDAGSSRFYVSLEDDVARRFGGDRIKGIMSWAGFDENTPIEHPMVSK